MNSKRIWERINEWKDYQQMSYGLQLYVFDPKEFY